jgi:hypothetical protein
MNLLNRYLQAVGRCLPKERRDDIVEELRINMLSQIEDREEVLGRPLTESEFTTMLQDHGNPMIVAGRYREANLGLAFGIQLIGPELFPFYRTILGINFAITFIIVAVVLPIVAQFAREAITPARILTPLVAQFFAVTAIFIALDRGKGHVVNRWDPGKLPALKADPDDGPTAANIFGFICLAVGTVWLLLTPRWPYLMLGPGALYLPALALKPMPEWIGFYWAIGVLLCAQLVLQFFRLVRWLPRQKARIADVILRSVGLVIGVLLLLKAPNYVTSEYPEVTKWANLNFEVCIAVWVAISVWRTGWMLFSLLRKRHQMLPARQY